MFCRKKEPMVIVSKLLSLACKCIFYRPDHNPKERRHGFEFF